MDVERTKGGRPAPVVVGHALGGVKGEFVRPPDLEGREGQPPDRGESRSKPRRTSAPPTFGWPRGVRLGPDRRPARATWAPPWRRRRIRSADFWPRLEGRGAADENEDLRDRAEFGVERRRDMPDIMRVDPTLEELRRNGKPSLPRSDRHQRQAPEPAVEDVVADFRPQARAAAPPCLVKRRTAESALVDAIRIGFVIHIHECSPGVKVDSRKCGDAEEREALDALGLRPGQPACLPPAGAASSARIVQRTFESIRDIETGPPPRARHRDCGLARPRARTAQEHQRRAALDPRGLQERLETGGEIGVDRHRRIGSAIPRTTASCRAHECRACRRKPTPPWSGRRSKPPTHRPQAEHRRRPQADLQHIQRSFDKTLPLPPQPALRISMWIQSIRENGPKKPGPQLRARTWLRPPLSRRSYRSVYSFCLLTPRPPIHATRNHFSLIAWRRQELWHGSGDGATFASRQKGDARAAKGDKIEQLTYVFMQGLDSKDKIAMRLQPVERKYSRRRLAALR